MIWLFFHQLSTHYQQTRSVVRWIFCIFPTERFEYNFFKEFFVYFKGSDLAVHHKDFVCGEGYHAVVHYWVFRTGLNQLHPSLSVNCQIREQVIFEFFVFPYPVNLSNILSVYCNLIWHFFGVIRQRLHLFFSFLTF